MYLKKAKGPRAVTLDDGSVLSLADLPEPDTKRWVASRKAVVVYAVSHGLMTREEALKRYALSEEEFSEWQSAVERFGVAALKTTNLMHYRQP